MLRRIRRHLERFLSKKLLAGAALAVLLMSGNVKAEAAKPEQLYLEMNQAYHLYPSDDDLTIIRVAVTNPAIADVRVIDNTSLNIVGYKDGSTSLTVWYSDESMEDYNITVAPTDTGYADLIKRIMNVPGVQVEKIADRVLLRGSVNNQYQKNQAQMIAEMFADKEHVINLLKTTKPLQINLAALVIDISSNDAKDIGFSYGNSNVDTNSKGNVSVSDITFGTVGTFYGGQNYHHISGKVGAPVDVMLRALISQGKAEILSRPNITTLSGEEANILIGGEIPVPTSKDGEISVTWRDYGIKLNIEPTSDDAENITAKVQAEISTLDYAHQVSTSAGTIPALTSRKAGTSVSLKSGTALAIGGLLNSEDAKTVTKIPLLGDIPIIGQFFRHTSTSKEKREMLILLVPSIVDEYTPVSTTEKMADVLNKSKLEQEAMPKVNVNAPPSRNEKVRRMP
ncbi:MAG: pilus assembly protein N-terminal domain-containing protein [Schwartzia sp.]|nr:pilus assembly protein N-terminal domain-containing protein [Schwartzia sp. (in: firmicutes)]